MTPARKEAILTAARGLGAEDFNRLVESVGQTRVAKRLRYWQEELLAKLSGVAPVSFAEFVAAFDGAKRIKVPRKKAAKEIPKPDLRHPKLGGMYRDEERWVGAIRLPRFAAAGAESRDEDGPPAGYLIVSVHDPAGKGVSAEQDAALAWLKKHEAEVFEVVSRELAAAVGSSDPIADFACSGIEVSRHHLGGVAYLGFNIADVDPEHGFQVVYHPAKGTQSGDGEAIFNIDEADNL